MTLVMGFLPGLQEHTKGSEGCVFRDTHPIFPLSFIPLVPVIYLSLSPKKSFSLLGHLLRMCISPSPPSDSFSLLSQTSPSSSGPVYYCPLNSVSGHLPAGRLKFSTGFTAHSQNQIFNNMQHISLELVTTKKPFIPSGRR